MKNILFTLTLLISFSSFGQDDYNESITNSSFDQIYFKVGRNDTKFQYSGSGSNFNTEKSGTSYELGVVFIKNDKLTYSAAMTLDEYGRARSLGVEQNIPAWYYRNIKFFGVQSLAKYNILDLNTIPIKINIEGGLNLNGNIGSGLENEDELLRGLFIKPIVGLNLQYIVNDRITIESEYKFSYNYGLWNGTKYDGEAAYFNFFNNDLDLNFLNQQIQFGVLFTLN